MCGKYDIFLMGIILEFHFCTIISRFSIRIEFSIKINLVMGNRDNEVRAMLPRAGFFFCSMYEDNTSICYRRMDLVLLEQNTETIALQPQHHIK